jgi:hypothetical protein
MYLSRFIEALAPHFPLAGRGMTTPRHQGGESSQGTNPQAVASG